MDRRFGCGIGLAGRAAGINPAVVAFCSARFVLLPLEAPYLWSYGSLAGFSKTIVEVETIDGLVGLGEGPSPANAATIAEIFAPRLIGQDAVDIEACERLCLPSWRGIYTDVDFASIRAFGAIEMALWDLRGKA